VPLCVVLALALWAAAEEAARPSNAQSGITGLLKRHEAVTSKFVDARNVDVWLPPGYERNKSQRYPVVYVHDGQNLFDPKCAFAGVEWGIDETMTRLIEAGTIREAIVVGIWNISEKRLFEYMPRKAVATDEDETRPKGFPNLKREQITSDSYLRFIVDELKPLIDATYRTLPDRDNAFIMGASMGGLISAYAMAEYPDLFSGAGCISTHWPANDGVVIDYLKEHLPDARSHKFYFDYGTEGLDAHYEPHQQRMDDVLRSGSYEEGKNWMTRKFPGEDHSDRAWSKRIDLPLRFMLGK
jgi:predicted alpha/beta superfamily hydrolase